MAKPHGKRHHKQKTHLRAPTIGKIVGVIGGDISCMRTVLNCWTGRSSNKIINGEQSIIQLSDVEGRRDLVFLLNVFKPLIPWPGGALIWLLPERGPSDPELAQLRLVLAANESAYSRLIFLLCLPHDVNPTAASNDLDIISETLSWAVDSNVEAELNAVWLSGPYEHNLESFLAKLE